MICKNCQYNFEGKFCSNCGQNSNVQKFNLKQVVKEFSDSVFQVNRGVLFTIKELFTRPGITIREYLKGKRKQHFKPLAFVLLMSTLYAFFTYFTSNSTFINDGLSGFLEASKKVDSDKKHTVLIWIANNFAYATLILLPLFSLASYLVFIKSKYNYFEHLILNFFLTGQQILIYILFNFLCFLFTGIEDFVQSISFLSAIIFTFWAFVQFFETKKTFLKIALTFLTYIIYFIFMIFLLLPISLLEILMKN